MNTCITGDYPRILHYMQSRSAFFNYLTKNLCKA